MHNAEKWKDLLPIMSDKTRIAGKAWANLKFECNQRDKNYRDFEWFKDVQPTEKVLLAKLLAAQKAQGGNNELKFEEGKE